MSKAQVNAKMNLDTSGVQKSMRGIKAQFKSMGASMVSTMKSAGKAAARALVASFTAAIAVIGAIITGGIGAALKNGFDQTVLNQSSEALMKSLLGGADKAKEAMKMLGEEAKENPIFSAAELKKAGAILASFADKDVGKLKGLIETSQLLTASSPGKTIEDAAIAMKNALAGDFVSLQERFDISPKEIQKLKAKGLKGKALIDELLIGKGISQQTLNDLSNTTAGMMAKIKNRWNDISLDLFDRFAPQLQKFSTQFLGWVTANKPVILSFMTALTQAAMGLFQFALTHGKKLFDFAQTSFAFISGYIEGWKNMDASSWMDSIRTAYEFFKQLKEALLLEWTASYYKAYNEVMDSLFQGLKGFFEWIKVHGKEAMTEALMPQWMTDTGTAKDKALAFFGNDAAQERLGRKEQRKDESFGFKDIFSPLDALERTSRNRADNQWNDVGRSWMDVRQTNPMIKEGYRQMREAQRAIAARDAEAAKIASEATVTVKVQGGNNMHGMQASS